MEERIEQKVCDAILQRASGVLEVDGDKYEIAPPTMATIIMASALAAKVPVANKNIPRKNCALEVLRFAKDASVIGEVAAVLVLGALGLKGTEPRKWLGPLAKFFPGREVDLKSRLSEKILLHCSPREVSMVITKRLIDMGVEDFFDVTTSLNETNPLRPTRDGEVETTAFGQLFSEQPRTSE